MKTGVKLRYMCVFTLCALTTACAGQGGGYAKEFLQEAGGTSGVSQSGNEAIG